MPYTSFQELPNHVKAWLRESDQPDLENWVKRPIPALQNRSILEVMALPDGERLLADFLGRLSKFQ